MSQKLSWPITLLVVALVFAMVGRSGVAAPPWTMLVPFKKATVDAKQPQKLTKANGPWMIMAMSFSGDEAEEQADKLVLELRRDHKLPAYAHVQEIDLTENVSGLGVNQYNKPKKMKYLHGGESQEIAVLVGNFASFDDPEAAKTLERVRYLQVKSVSGMSSLGRSEAVTANHMRAFYRSVSKSKEQRRRGALGKAFMTRNPLLPADDVAKQSLDPFVADMNRGVPNSLLENPGQYTVLIATYRGTAAFNEAEFSKSIHENGNKIDKAAEKAHIVVLELRKQGVEAYEFHDRHESIVTVGHFDDLGSESASGRTELLPEVAAVIKRFEASRNAIAGTDQLGLQPKLVANIAIDVSPRLIVVPRKSIADVYRQEN